MEFYWNYRTLGLGITELLEVSSSWHLPTFRLAVRKKSPYMYVVHVQNHINFPPQIIWITLYLTLRQSEISNLDMQTNLLLLLCSYALTASAQSSQVHVQDPATSILTYTMSGVLPVLPTAFAGVFTIQGALIDDDPVNPGFMGLGGSAVV